MHKNYNTENEKIKRIKEKTLVIGVDIAKDAHYARVLNWRKIEVNKGIKFTNMKEGFEKFLRWQSKVLKQEGATDILVAMEPTGTYYFVLEEYLERIGIEVVIVNGRDVRRTSEVMGNDSSKNDPRDALIISRLAIDGRYSESLRPKEGNYAELRELVSLRELLEEDQIRNTNRLHTVNCQNKAEKNFKIKQQEKDKKNKENQIKPEKRKKRFKIKQKKSPVFWDSFSVWRSKPN